MALGRNFHEGRGNLTEPQQDGQFLKSYGNESMSRENVRCRHGSRSLAECCWSLRGSELSVVSGCETNPYTGRSQLLMTSVIEEMQLGAQAYSQVKNDPKMRQSQDPREIEPVKRVAARIVEAAKRSKYAEMANNFSGK